MYECMFVCVCMSGWVDGVCMGVLSPLVIYFKCFLHSDEDEDGDEDVAFA